MKLPDNELLELNELCNALVDGAITHPQRARLQQLLAASEEARRFYVRAMALSASLFECASEMQLEAPVFARASAAEERPAPGLWRLIGSLAAAAMLVIAFWVGGLMKHDEGEPAIAAHESHDSIARLSGSKDCRWIGAAFSSGDELRAGERIELASGFAEITFDSGAQLVLEGPAVLDLTSAWEAVLRRGTLKAIVPPEAIGFRVSNPAVEVVDLGTEFSMVADESGATEVFVIKGAVEAKAGESTGGDRGPVVLREAQARRFARRGISDVRDREQKLRKLSRKIALERITRPAGYAHWSFDEAGGNIAAARLIGLTREGFDARLEAPPERVSNARLAGRWQRALRFDGQLFAKAEVSGMSVSGARTAAFWLNIPADAPLSAAGPILTFPAHPARRLEVAWNRQPAHGPLGALRTNVGRGFAVGATPLRDGRWHHIAVVLTPAPRSSAKIQVKQYVDGRL
ncbi:MAG: FecR domain-containing protein, partial [Verrucomicrobiota bacterium]|nr:FecR domain-containing protein [Verrucomicrobiota bacterium]